MACGFEHMHGTHDVRGVCFYGLTIGASDDRLSRIMDYNFRIVFLEDCKQGGEICYVTESRHDVALELTQKWETTSAFLNRRRLSPC